MMAPMTKLTRVTLADSLLTQLRQQILSGRLAAGRPVPSERELREAFGVGRTTVREALQGLVAAGYVSRQNSQLVVNDPMLLPSDEIDYGALAARLSVEDVFETRKALEGKAAELAARNFAVEDERLLEQPLEVMKDPTDEETYHRADADFHSAIVRVAKNQVLEQVYESSKHLFFRLPTFWRVFPPGSAARARPVGSGWAGHHRLYEAIAARQPERAAQLMFEHLDLVQTGLVARMTADRAANRSSNRPQPSPSSGGT